MPDNPIALQYYEANIIWGEIYTCFSLGDPTRSGTQSIGILTMDDLLFAPLGYVWADKSPDGRWALLVGGQGDVRNSQYPDPELLVYSLQTGETEPLFAQPGETMSRLAHGPLAQPFVWSPMLDN